MPHLPTHKDENAKNRKWQVPVALHGVNPEDYPDRQDTLPLNKQEKEEKADAIKKETLR